MTYKICVANPFSRGNVTIASKDTADRPIVSPNWLLDPRDQELAVAGFKVARQVFTSPGASGIVLGDEVFPGLNVSSDAQILDLIQRSAAASYHASATCAMGKAEDENAVLDSKARVIGVDKLRVVDASAFPVLPPGHPASTVCECCSLKGWPSHMANHTSRCFGGEDCGGYNARRMSLAITVFTLEVLLLDLVG